MAAGDTIFAARHFKFPTNAVAGVTNARIRWTFTASKDQGAAGSTGPADRNVNNRRVELEVYGTNFAALLALVGATKANAIVGTYGAAGALEKRTLKNVYFHSPIGNIEVPEKDGGGKLSVFGIKGIGLWGANDTPALMDVAASDA